RGDRGGSSLGFYPRMVARPTRIPRSHQYDHVEFRRRGTDELPHALLLHDDREPESGNGDDRPAIPVFEVDLVRGRAAESLLRDRAPDGGSRLDTALEDDARVRDPRCRR